MDLAAAGRAGLGVVDLRLDGPLDAQAAIVTELRARLPVGRGSAVIRRGDPALRQQVGAWGPIGDALPVMQAIKRQFDPTGTLNPRPRPRRTVGSKLAGPRSRRTGRCWRAG